MTAKQKKQLLEAVALIEKAGEIICKVKNERKGINNDDDYFMLEHFEYCAYEVSTPLKDAI